MGSETMPELITREAFDAGLRVFAIVAFVACLAVGAAWGARNGAAKRGLLLGGLCSLLAPLTYGLWLFYCHNVAYDPATGTAGLHRVSVLLMHIGVFAVIGIAIGLIAARATRRGPQPTKQ